jgi:hypothetical protein
MVSWLIDHATLCYLVLVCVALGLLAAWWRTRKQPFLIGLGVTAALAALVLALTLFVDTDRKQIERSLRALAAGMRDRPPTRMFEQISKKFQGTFLVGGTEVTWDFKQICAQIIRGQEAFQIEEIKLHGIQIRDLSGTEATVEFEALPVGPTIRFFPCEAEYAREEDGVWRIRALKIFDPVNPKKLFNIPR